MANLRRKCISGLSLADSDGLSTKLTLGRQLMRCSKWFSHAFLSFRTRLAPMSSTSEVSYTAFRANDRRSSPKSGRQEFSMTDRPSHAHLQFESRPAGAPLSADVVSTREDLFHCPVWRKRSETILQVSPYITEAEGCNSYRVPADRSNVIDAQ